MSEEKEKVSHFDKPISEITFHEVQVMSREDVVEYVIEHPITNRHMMDEDNMSLRKIWTYSSLMNWALELVTGKPR